MSSKQTKARVNKAFQAMKELGISEDKVKPVLKNLLKLFDKNWSLIEAENYRALIDAIFDSEEAPATLQSTNVVNSQMMINVSTQNEDETDEEQESEPLARPSKRLRLQHRDGQSSSLNQSSNGVVQAPLMRPKDEPGELLEVNTISQQPVSSKSSIVHEGGNSSQPSGSNRGEKNIPNESTLPSHRMSLRNRGKGSISPNIPSKGNRHVSGNPSDSLHLEGPTVVPDTVLSPKQKSSATPAIKIKDEPITDDVPLLEIPLAVICPDPSNGADSTSRDGTVGDDHPEPSRYSASEPQPAFPNEQRSNGTVVTRSNEFSSNIELASSPFGEVKISLSCNAVFQRPNFQMPSLEAVLKYVDEKCLQSYKILDPNFSVKNIMKDMCQSILELGSESSTVPPKSIDVTPAIDLLKKSSATNTRGARGVCFSSFNESVDCRFNTEVPLPVTPPTPSHCDGIDDVSQPNQNSGGDESGSDKEEQGLSLVLVQQPEVATPDIIRPLHDVGDMAKGQEKVLIVLVNEVNDSLPPSFYYIPQNAIFQNANVNFSLARVGGNNCCTTCFGDCLSSATPCVCATEGEFLYTADGLVKEELLNECISMNRDPKKHCKFFCMECPLERSKSVDSIEPCKGHLIKKFIKECWLKCGCNKQCGNRVVQRGISRNLQVFMTPEGKGWGLRTLEDLPKGAFVCEYVGEVLTVAEFFDRVLQSPKREKESYPVLLDGAWSGEAVLKDEDALCLNATHFGNVSRFINHRCYDSNLVEIPVEVETPDHHYYHVAFFTTREVKATEELTWDYGLDFDDNDNPIKAFRCQCGSTFCRNIKRFSLRSGRRV